MNLYTFLFLYLDSINVSSFDSLDKLYKLQQTFHGIFNQWVVRSASVCCCCCCTRDDLYRKLFVLVWVRMRSNHISVCHLKLVRPSLRACGLAAMQSVGALLQIHRQNVREGDERLEGRIPLTRVIIVLEVGRLERRLMTRVIICKRWCQRQCGWGRRLVWVSNLCKENALQRS